MRLLRALRNSRIGRTFGNIRHRVVCRPSTSLHRRPRLVIAGRFLELGARRVRRRTRPYVFVSSARLLGIENATPAC